MVVKGTKAQQAVIPVSAAEKNITETKLSADVKAGWKVESTLEITRLGSAAEKTRRAWLDQAPEKLNEFLTNSVAERLREASVADIAADFRETSHPVSLKARVEHELTEEGGLGERLLNPWVFESYDSPLFKATERSSAVSFEFLEKRISTSKWRLHPGLTVEALPKEVHLVSDVGEYAHSCAKRGHGFLHADL